MTAKHALVENPIVLKSDDLLRDIMPVICGKGVHGHFMQVNFPVVDKKNHLIGMFGGFQLISDILPRSVTMEDGLEDVSYVEDNAEELSEKLSTLYDKPLSELVTNHYKTVAPNTSLMEALLLIHQTRMLLPVVDPTTKEFVGALSVWSIIDALQKKARK